MTSKKLTLLYPLILSSSLAFSKPIPADESSSFQPPTSMLVPSDPAAIPASTQDVAQVEPSTPAVGSAISPATPSPSPAEDLVQDTYTPQATPTSTPKPSKAQQDQDVRLSAESHVPQPPAHQDTATLFSDTWDTSSEYTSLPTLSVDEAASQSQILDSELDTTTTSSIVRTTYYATSTPQSTASFVSQSSFATHSSIKPVTTMPTHKDQGLSAATQASRRAAIAGTLLAICIVLSLVGCLLCMRCRRRAALSRKSKAPSQQYVEDQEKGSIHSEKDIGSPSSKSDSTEGMTLPVLPSNAPITGHPLTQDRWRYLATNEAGQFQDVTHVLVGGPYMEISLESNADIHSTAGSVGGQSAQDSVVLAGDRTSAGATSTTQSYSTCASRYSEQSTEVPHDVSVEDIDFLPTFLCSPPPVVKQGRARSRTVTSSTGGYPSRLPLVASSKSFPTKLSSTSDRAESRLSAESGRSVVTKRSTGSEWDVAREYGRFSKESMGGSSILSTISEDPEHMEAIEVGKKSCLLVTGKF